VATDSNSSSSKKTGLTLPVGIFQPTTTTPPEPEPEPESAGQGGDLAVDDATADAVEPDATSWPRSPKPRKKKAAASAAPLAGSDKLGDVKLYLSEDVRFRLRMLAFRRGAKLSAVANEVLDKALPRWTLERTE
jgi:hypothetical protein